MYSQLGNITFDGRKAPSAFSVTKESNIAEHPLIENRPTLQRVGDKLDAITMTMFFDQSFCTPTTEIESLESSRKLGEIMGLVMGDGRYLGEFVIKRIAVNSVSDAPNGAIMQAEVEVELIEYYDPDRETTTQLSAIASGFAMLNNEPPAFEPIIVPLTEGSDIMGNVVDSNANINSSSSILEGIEKTAALFRQKAETVIRNLTNASESLNTVLTAINDPSSENYGITQQLAVSISIILLLIPDVVTECSQLIQDVDSGNTSSAATRVASLAQRGSEIQSRQRQVMSDASRLTSKTTTK